MKEISIRKYIIDSFKNDNVNEIKESIESSINEELEEALPGLGVFMEVIWKNIDEKKKNELLEILKTHLN